MGTRRILLDECVVAVLLDPSSDLVEGVVPGDVLPVRGARPAHLRLQQTPVVHDLLLQRRALWTKRAAVRGLIGVALAVDHLRSAVFLAVSIRVDVRSAAHSAAR